MPTISPFWPTTVCICTVLFLLCCRGDGLTQGSSDNTAPVVVFAGADLIGATPGSQVPLKAVVDIRDGSSLQSLRWRAQPQDGRVNVVVNTEAQTEASVALPDLAEYKRMLLYRLGKDGRLLNRWMVLGLAPSDLREVGSVTLQVTAVTSSGSYSDSIDIQADLHPLATAGTGVQNLPVNEPVLLQGKPQATYNWSLSGPGGSQLSLNDPTTANPYFTPDVTGKYLLAEGGEARLTLYVGTWRGGFVHQQSKRRPQWAGKDGCLCHFNGPLAETFAQWGDSGHAEIFSQVLTASDRNGERCFVCHSVGFSPAAATAGIDDAPDYQAFLSDAQFWEEGSVPRRTRKGSDNWRKLMATYPGVAQRANVQCENCHGPNDSEAHTQLSKTGAPERMSSSSLVCGMCHEKPFGDQSYRQWQESGHANYNLALATATLEQRGAEAGNCGRCHSVQGFLAWTAGGDRGQLVPGKNGAADPEELAALGLTSDKVHPITCSVCHDPHNPGNSFRGKQEKVSVRLVAKAGTTAAAVTAQTGGRGALCILCHSTTGGSANSVRPIKATAPHAPQGDVLLGENAFFLESGRFKSHAKVEDSCIWCHMKPVPKPSALGYPRGQTRHSFKAGIDDCNQCHEQHKGPVGEEIMLATNLDLERLKLAVEGALLAEIGGGAVTLKPASREAVDIYLPSGAVTGLLLVTSQGEMGIEITTGDGGVYTVSLANLQLGGVSLLATGNGQILAKAAWNYLLAKNDNSRGAHNPRFVLELLGATMAKLADLKPARALGQ